MKIVTKIIVAMLSLAMVLSFCACGETPVTNQGNGENQNTASSVQTGDKDTDKNSDSTAGTENTAPVAEAEVGAILDAPEKIMTAEKFCVDGTFAFEEDSTKQDSIRFDVDDTSDTIGIVALTFNSFDEAVYELDSSKLSLYIRGVFDDNFKKADVEDEDATKNEIIIMLAMVGYGWTNVFGDNMKYQKCENEMLPLTGDAYVYELIVDGASSGEKIWVDQDTGVIAKMTDADGTVISSIMNIELNNADIPDYK